MPKKWTLTLLDVIVVIGVISLLWVLFMSAIPRVNKIPQRAVCGTNLKGLGTAMTVYANDYDDRYPQLPGDGPWAKRLGFDYDLPHPDFGQGVGQSQTPRTITASWYLLVREADVWPKSFVCPQSQQTVFDGQNPANLDITELWDFGSEPHQHISYALHNPYGKYPPDGSRGAAFAVAADMSPWFNAGDIVKPASAGGHPQIIEAADPQTWTLGVSSAHPELRGFSHDRPVPGTRTGQSIIYGDGHSAWERSPNCGIQKDNIYTYWSKENEPTDQDIQGGQNPTARDKQNDAKAKEDSFLAI